MDQDIFLRKPRVWFSFFVVMPICLVHESSSAMVTPKYFAAEIFSSQVRQCHFDYLLWSSISSLL